MGLCLTACHPYGRNPEPITLIIITVGAGIFLKGAAMIVWGKDPFSMPSFSSHESIEIFGAALLPQSIWIVTAALVLAGGIHLFLKQTLTGKAWWPVPSTKKRPGSPASRRKKWGFWPSVSAPAAGRWQESSLPRSP